MHLENFAGKKIQIKFKNFPNDLVGSITGIFQPDEWYLVKLIKTESMGIWVENPCFKRTMVQKEDGTNIPEEQQKEEDCVTHFLIRWDYISSVITFPDKTTLGVDKKAKLIGFQPS